MDNKQNAFGALKGGVVELVKLCLYGAIKVAIETLVIWQLLGYLNINVTFKETLAGLLIVRLTLGNLGSQTRIVEKEKKESNVKSTGKQQPHFRN